MSSGDEDDELCPPGTLQRLEDEYPQLTLYLNTVERLPIVFAACPFLGGISEDGQTIIIWEGLNHRYRDTDTTPVIRVHEAVEWGVRKFCGIGVNYAEDNRGHRIANRAERRKAFEVLSPVVPGMLEDDIWREYNSFLQPQLALAESAPIDNVYSTMDLYPYVGTKWYDLLKEKMK